MSTDNTQPPVSLEAGTPVFPESFPVAAPFTTTATTSPVAAVAPPPVTSGDFDTSSDHLVMDEPAAETPAPVADEGMPPQVAFRQNFTLTEGDKPRPFTTEGFTGWDDELESAYLPGATTNNILRGLASADNNVRPDGDSSVSEYLLVAGVGSRQTPMDDAMVRTSNREDADWVQDVAVGGRQLSGGTPRVRPPAAGVTFTAEASRNFFRGGMKLGTVFMAPLWHSGFWITLKAPSDSAIMELNRLIAEEKVAVGRQTYGRIFSSTVAYSAKHMLDFVMAHLYSTSLALPEGADLTKYIALPDLQLLYWGMVCSMYPTGFQYSRACTVAPLTCRYTVREKLNLARLLWTDQSKISEKQRQHMTKMERHSMTLESVQAYRDEFLVGKNRHVKIGEVTVELAVPAIDGYLQSAFRWISFIENTYGLAMQVPVAEREAYLQNHHRATQMREYTHCVKSFSRDNVVEDRQEVIESLLNDFSEINDVRDKFIEEVTKFLEDATIALPAIPTYTCPVCKKPQNVTQEGSPYPELIPLDVSQTFFHLAYQRQKFISQRQLKAD